MSTMSLKGLYCVFLRWWMAVGNKLTALLGGGGSPSEPLLKEKINPCWLSHPVTTRWSLQNHLFTAEFPQKCFLKVYLQSPDPVSNLPPTLMETAKCCMAVPRAPSFGSFKTLSVGIDPFVTSPLCCLHIGSVC